MKISQNLNQTDFIGIFGTPNMSSSKGAALTSYKNLQKTIESEEQKKIAKRFIRFKKAKKRKAILRYGSFRKRFQNQSLFNKKELRKFKD